jgi:hypothetical protein
MEQPQYIIDSNAVVDYLGKKLPPEGMLFMNTVIDAIPNISVVTRIEVLGFNAPEEYYSLLTDFMDDTIIFDLSEDIIKQSISLRKRHKIKLPDVIMAATAIENGMQLISRNIKDFTAIEGLKIINPWDVM